MIVLVVPTLGIAAAAGLVAYFICALTAHFRARDHNVGGAITFLLLAVATRVVTIEYRYH
jgi:hypothetical protein